MPMTRFASKGSKRMLWHDIRLSFRKSLGRFLSIVLLVGLGSFALVGLNISGPDMRDTGNAYFAQHHLADLNVIGSYGLDKADREVIANAAGASHVEFGYLKDVVLRGTDESIRIYSAPKTVSTYNVVEGRLPRRADEVAIDNSHDKRYPIGSTVHITEKADALGRKVLRRGAYKVVGVTTSTEVLGTVNMGASTSGSGSLDGYMVVTPGAFKSDDSMIARITYTDLDGMHDHYSNAYNKRLERHRRQLNRDLARRPSVRFEGVRKQANSQIDEGKAQVKQAQDQFDSARSQLEDANKQLADGAAKIENAKSQLVSQTSAAQSQIAAGRAKVQSGQAQYDAGKRQYDSKASQVAAARAKVDEGYNRINQAQAQADASVAKLESAKKRYDDGIAALTRVQTTIQALQAKVTAGTITSAEQAELTALLAEHPAIGTEIQNTQTAQSAFIAGTYNPGMAQVSAARAQIAQKKAEVDAANAQVASGQTQLAEARSQLDASAAQLAQGRAAVASGQQQLASKQQQAQAQIDASQAELDQKTNEYNSKKAEFDKAEPGAKSEIAKAQKKLDDATAMLNAMEEPVYSIDSKREVPGSDGYKVYDSVSVIVDSLSRIFPYFMYFVAALVTFTTMTRFVEEERINAGTLKALGYSNSDVMAKFVVYGLTASLTGAALGILTGHVLLPIIVYNAYKVGFNVPRIQLGFHWPVTVLAVLLALLSAVLPAVISASRELRDKPAVLMLPKPPSAGSKILLERIPLIWNHLNFTHKVTARNIFRYKQRMFMTIFGVAGSVALLTAGFGVQGSISGISAHQFGDVMHYHLIAAENNHVTDSQRKAIQTRLKQEDIERSASIRYEDVTKVAGRNDDKQDITLIVPEHTNDFNKYVELNTRVGHKPLELSRQGAVVSERFANLVGAKKGSVIEVKDSQGATRKIKVTGVCEMYLGHFIFMSPSAYSSAFNRDYEPNAHMVNLKNGSVDNTKRQSASFMKLGGIKGVVQNTTLITQIDVVVKALNQIMWVLIAVAVMLGLVILYNLTNLNVAERIRELSTIKVLGFYNGEVTMYIYRETILLSALGILAGYGFGALLQHYIITAVPPDNVMFDPAIAWPAFVVPLVVVTLITAVLGYFVYQRLKNVDMLAALKSVD